jgi:hypothetical protein
MPYSVTTKVTDSKYIYFSSGKPVKFDCSSNDFRTIDRCVIDVCDRLGLDYDKIDHINDRAF